MQTNFARSTFDPKHKKFNTYGVNSFICIHKRFCYILLYSVIYKNSKWLMANKWSHIIFPFMLQLMYFMVYNLPKYFMNQTSEYLLEYLQVIFWNELVKSFPLLRRISYKIHAMTYLYNIFQFSLSNDTHFKRNSKEEWG